MQVEQLRINDVVIITPGKIGDNRGYFMETLRQDLVDEEAGSIRFGEKIATSQTAHCRLPSFPHKSICAIPTPPAYPGPRLNDRSNDAN